MTKITIEIEDELVGRLESEAAKRNTSIDELVGLGVRRVLVDRTEEVSRIANNIVTEEEGLLRRL